MLIGLILIGGCAIIVAALHDLNRVTTLPPQFLHLAPRRNVTKRKSRKLAANNANARIIAMTKHREPPEATLRRYKDGSGWFLEAIGDDGVAENIGDFNSEAEAIDWIVHKSEAFFKARKH